MWVKCSQKAVICTDNGMCTLTLGSIEVLEASRGRGESGAALLTVLLYLLVITLIALSMFQVSLLQFKMAHHFQMGELAFQHAESTLRKGELMIAEGDVVGEGAILEVGSYRFERLDVAVCGFLLYQVNAIGYVQASRRELESVLLLPKFSEECAAIKEKKRRVLWREKKSI